MVTPVPVPRRAATIREAALYARVANRTMYYWVKKGWLPAWQLGPKMLRVDLDDIDRMYTPVFRAGVAGGD